MIYAWLVKNLAWVGGVIFIFASVFGVGNYYGRAHVQAKWDADKASTQDDSFVAINNRIAENEAIRTQSERDNKKIKEDYENKIADLNKRRHDGLYLHKSPACGSAAVSPADSAAGRANDPAPGVRLPGAIEQNLRALADDANVCAIRLRALQEWVAGN